MTTPSDKSKKEPLCGFPPNVLQHRIDQVWIEDRAPVATVSFDEASPTNPAHYHTKGCEPIDLIRDAELDFCRGNVVKYVARAGKKPGEKASSDLMKAKTYLEWAIADALENES